MSWKKNLQLRDLDENQPIEVTCHKCGHSHYEQPLDLLKKQDLKYAYLDEVEASLSCKQRGCHGTVRIALSSDRETEGFMGGLA